MNADQMEIPLPAPVLHALTEEAKKFGLSCEEYLKKIVIGINRTANSAEEGHHLCGHPQAG